MVVATVGDGDALLRAIEPVPPDAVIIDIRMSPTHTDEGIVAAQAIRERHPDVAILVLSSYLESEYATRLLDEVPARAGYLLKERVSDVGVVTTRSGGSSTANASSTRPSCPDCS